MFLQWNKLTEAHFMYQTAFVKKINSDGTVLVGCSTKACQNCKAEMFCNNKDHTDFLARNDSGLSLTEGQIVNLYLPPAPTILSTLLVFALPLAMFPVGYLLAKNLTTFNEILCALCGFAAMAVAFTAAALINIKHKRALMPLIVE